MCTTGSLLFVDQSSSSFFRSTWKWLWLNEFFPAFRYVDPFRRYSRSKLDVAKIDRILHVLAPNFFGGAPPPEFLDVKRDSDHVAKFQGDRSRELGDPALKKTSRQNISPSSRSGRPKYAEYVMFAVCI